MSFGIHSTLLAYCTVKFCATITAFHYFCPLNLGKHYNITTFVGETDIATLLHLQQFTLYAYTTLITVKNNVIKNTNTSN